MPASSYQQQKLRVCEVCSAYLGIHDNDRRLADHFGGKLHLGFITIREKLSELQVSRCPIKIVQERPFLWHLFWMCVLYHDFKHTVRCKTVVINLF